MVCILLAEALWGPVHLADRGVCGEVPSNHPAVEHLLLGTLGQGFLLRIRNPGIVAMTGCTCVLFSLSLFNTVSNRTCHLLIRTSQPRPRVQCWGAQGPDPHGLRMYRSGYD